jgi:hypothetical protein
VASILTALRNNAEEVPWELGEFYFDEALWTRFGTRANPERIEDWPRRKVRDYQSIMEAQGKVSREQPSSSSSSASGTPGRASRAEATEEAFRLMQANRKSRKGVCGRSRQLRRGGS